MLRNCFPGRFQQPKILPAPICCAGRRNGTRRSQSARSCNTGRRGVAYSHQNRAADSGKARRPFSRLRMRRLPDIAAPHQTRARRATKRWRRGMRASRGRSCSVCDGTFPIELYTRGPAKRSTGPRLITVASLLMCSESAIEATIHIARIASKNTFTLTPVPGVSTMPSGSDTTSHPAPSRTIGPLQRLPERGTRSILRSTRFASGTSRARPESRGAKW